jgi:hypothetical protein
MLIHEKEQVMVRKFKCFAITAVAAMALVAIPASAASAANFQTESSPAYVAGTASGEGFFNLNGWTAKCTSQSYKSNALSGSVVATVEVEPAYSQCSTLGQKVSFAFNGCKYQLSATSTSAGAVAIVCPPEKEIVVTMLTAGCTLKIKGQTPGSAVAYKGTGIGASRALDLNVHMENLKWSSSGGICGASGTNGTFQGSFPLKAYTNSALTVQQGLFIS